MSYWTGDIHESVNGVFTVLSDAAYADVSGKYFDRGATIIPSSKLSYDEKIAGELWDKSVDVAGLSKDHLEQIKDVPDNSVVAGVLARVVKGLSSGF